MSLGMAEMTRDNVVYWKTKRKINDEFCDAAGNGGAPG